MLVKYRARERSLALFICANLFLTGCASYQKKVGEARRMMSSGQFDGAISKLEPLANQEGKDQLVYLLDFATICQAAGNYERSSKAFLAADQMAEVKDYHSVSKIGASLLGSESMVQYKGDDYEKVLINGMLAINFLMEGKLEEAQVETRRLNEKLEHYRVDGKKNYEQNEFAYYLSALIWEANRRWDDAYIDFKKVYDLNPNIPYLEEDLVRAAYNARRLDAERKWKKQFGLSRPEDPALRENGELVVIYQQGWGPRKRPHPNWHRIPKLYPTRNYTKSAKLVVDGVGEVLSQPIYDVEKVAIKTLDDQYAPLIAKRVAGIVAKKAVANEVRRKDKTLGAILDIAMQVSDQADLRQWSTLPKSFQVAKLRLKPGKYKISVHGLNDKGIPTGESMEPQEVEVVKGKKTFLTWRSYN